MDWREYRVPLGLVAAAAMAAVAVWQKAPDYVVLQAHAAEDRRDSAEWRYEQTLVRLRESRSALALLQARADLPPDVKTELIASTRSDIDLYERRLACYESIMETGERRKCP